MCPICKLPAYEFKIDVILFSIIEVYKAYEKAHEVIFLKNGDFKVFTNETKECESTVKTIYDLPIEDKLKRGDSTKKMVAEDPLKKRPKNDIKLSWSISLY